MIIYNDKGLALETCEPYIIKEGEPVFVFEGMWNYYLKDLQKWLQKNPEKMYLDAGRGYYVLPKDVEEFLQKSLQGTIAHKE